MKLLSKSAVVLSSLFLVVAVTPGTAKAGGVVHLDTPSISIGWHDGGKRYKKRYYDRGHRIKKRHHRRHHYDDNYYGDHYYNDYRPRDYRYHKKRGRYHNKRYYDNYYHGGSRHHRRDYYYDRPRGYTEVCPRAGFSLYIDHGRRCSRHKNHYHCS